jgi:ComF family protein
MFDAARNALVRLLLEPACAACDALLERPLAGAICDRCWLGIAGVAPPWCARCGDELPAWQSGDAECARCLSRPPSFSIARSAGRYEGPLRDIVHAFKYRHRRLLAEPLGRMMRHAGADVLDGADAVVPVPLHPLRRVRRGFNQADDLARQLGLPVWRALRRSRRGPPQAGLTASARTANLTSAYGVSVTWALRARLGGSPLRDRVVVVVDDVMTTGATIEACSRVLLEAGAKSVRALTAARAVTSARQRHDL